MDQRLQYKSSYTEPDRRESGNTIELIGTGNHFLNITPVAQTLKATINKCVFLSLKNLYDTVIRQNSSLYSKKRSSPTPRLTEG